MNSIIIFLLTLLTVVCAYRQQYQPYQQYYNNYRYGNGYRTAVASNNGYRTQQTYGNNYYATPTAAPNPFANLFGAKRDTNGNVYVGTPENGIYLLCNGRGCPGRG